MQGDVLQRVHKAYLQGQQRAPSKTYTAPGRLFAEHLNVQVNSRVPETEFAAIQSCWGRNYQALLAARKNDFDGSGRQFQALRSELEKGGFSAEGALLVQVLLDPAEAYLHYKRNNYTRARELVLRGVSINHRLTDEFGYGIISAQRMQLFHNLLRITSREGRIEDTVRLAAAYLDDLEHDSNCLPGEFVWARIVRESVPESISQYYFDQICGEAALALAGSEDRELFGQLANHINNENCREGFAGHAHSWIATTQLRFDGKIQDYLDQACQLLELGKAAELSLWFATVFDVVAASRTLGLSGVIVADCIYEEACKMPEAPWIFSQPYISCLRT
jgi:hypothetical protein